MLGDIETGHHFESRDNRCGQLGRQQRQGVEDAIDPQADA
jgi:hypothetical protein